MKKDGKKVKREEQKVKKDEKTHLPRTLYTAKSENGQLAGFGEGKTGTKGPKSIENRQKCAKTEQNPTKALKKMGKPTKASETHQIQKSSSA